MHRKHTLPTCIGIALGLLLLSNASAQADLLQWDYSWQPSATQLAANGGGSGGYLTLTGVTGQSATGSSNTVVTNIRTFSTASVTDPNVFNHANISYTMQLQDDGNKNVQ